MNINKSKERSPLGTLLISIEDWQRSKLHKSLAKKGLTRGQWQGLMSTTKAYKLPTYIRDIIVAELPETESLFELPEVKMETEHQIS